MTNARLISGLSDIADAYDALLVDIWGVIHNGRDPFTEAIEACRRFRAERGPVVLISNSPRPGHRIPAQFDAIGVANDFYDFIATSGDATRDALASRAPGPAFKLGPDRDDYIYADTGLTFAPLAEAAFISCTGLYDDETEGPDDYAGMLAEAKARDLVMVCANPDLIVQRGDKIIYTAGALAQAYAQLGGEVVLAGKPHPPIYARALDAVNDAAGRDIALSRILAIGDGPDTDLAGAAAHEIDALFVASGILSGGASSQSIPTLLAERGAIAAYAATALRW